MTGETRAISLKEFRKIMPARAIKIFEDSTPKCNSQWPADPIKIFHKKQDSF